MACRLPPHHDVVSFFTFKGHRLCHLTTGQKGVIIRMLGTELLSYFPSLFVSMVLPFILICLLHDFFLYTQTSLLPHNLDDAWPVAVYWSGKGSYVCFSNKQLPDLSDLNWQRFMSCSCYISAKGWLGGKGEFSL